MNLTNQPIISFIIPVYNVESFLDQCLQSIIKQPIHKEIIIVDDGSTDGSLSIALDYTKKYSYITVIHSSNQGISAARNKGLRLAKGEYINFIDSDDYLIGDFTNLINQAKHTDVDFIILNAYFLFKDQSTQKIITYLDNNTITTGYDILKTSYEQNDWIPGVCWTLMKKSYLDKHQLVFQEEVVAEDQLFYLHLLTAVPNRVLIHFSDIHYIYRKDNPFSITHRKDSKYVEDHLKIITLIWEHSESQPELIKPYIYFIIQPLLKTIIQITHQWTMEQRKAFPYFYTEAWQQLLKQYYPNYWEYIKQLYEIDE
ncbi:hypothetical protein A6B43_08360 [Vespertiliibacter pulmonis]|uniref:Glycosyltransferase involved in cell wall biosynthesis n=1 Tax=Vespertiliibacter pulmonis TaxID=1443036 RepID=A0A3N4WLD5_9PAST|nr:glycosyltransferase [Vespertiliibacter pulmonis]QLB21535.1 hypothetical protein A6B43_08360 [Vespertiliibacter pulmonis]RPE85954.1 glycosyltransferase involved in cell wall biosynthesis [Vespertiliibacter pulmonis]